MALQQSKEVFSQKVAQILQPGSTFVYSKEIWLSEEAKEAINKQAS